MSNSLLKSLILCFRKGDMSAFTLIYDQFKKLIFHYSNKICSDDAMQELNIFLIELLYEINLSHFPNNDDNSIQRYISVSIKNEFLKILKRNAKYHSLCCDTYSKEFSSNSCFDDLFIKEALEELSEKQRLIIIYKYIYNYSDIEISNALDISRQAVNRLKNRALDRLKAYYLRE